MNAIKSGDVDGNKIVDIIDALMIAQYTVGLNPAGFLRVAADVNQDKKITIVDALVIARYYVGIEPALPLPAPVPTNTPS